MFLLEKSNENFNSVEILFRKFEVLPAPFLPPLGAGHIRFLYYREMPNLGVIQLYRDWGAPAAGRSPWSVIRQEVFYRAEKF